MAQVEYDVIIVGSGAGGGMAIFGADVGGREYLGYLGPKYPPTPNIPIP